MTILEKLHAIEEAKTIYDIHYCNAGIGFIFFYPEKAKQNWKEGLNVECYYPSFEKAIEAEYNKLGRRG